MTQAAEPPPQLEFERALAENARYAGQFDRSALPLPPGRRLAVLACMDARLTVEDVLGLRTGDAHIIRNAGGLATDDAIRSLVISQHLLGTEEIIVIEHTGCGMLTFEDEPVREKIAADQAASRSTCPSSPSPTSRRTCARRSAGSRPIRGSRRFPSTASSTRWRPAGCGRSPDPRSQQPRTKGDPS